MPPTVNILTTGTRGVDMKSNPLGLGNQKLHAATNITFDEGVVRTRPGFDYHKLGISGAFQGACAFAPSMGISAESFGPALSGLVIAAGGKVHVIDTTGGFIGCAPVDLTCEGEEFRCLGEVNLFQAENYLVVQNRNGNTHWWTGDGCLVKSTGLADDQYWEDPEPPKIEFVHAPAEAENACCDTFVCYDPGGNSTPSCSGSFPDTARPPMGVDGGGSGSGGSSGGAGGGGGGSNSSSSRSSSSSSRSSSSSSRSSSSSVTTSSSSSGGSSSGSRSSSSSSRSSSSCTCSFEITGVILTNDDAGEFTLTNTGTCTITDVVVTALSGSPYSIVLVSPPTITPGNSASVTVSRPSNDMRLTNFEVSNSCGTATDGWPNYP